MNWKKYWIHFSSQQISSNKKDEIFSRITKITTRPSLYNRWSYYVRPVASIVGVSVLWVAVFIIWFIGDSQVSQNVSDTVQQNIPMIAQASPVWRIVQTQWIVWLESDWIITPIESIVEWKIISLQDSAKIVFSINDEVQATITGPARFIIEVDTDNWVLLNVLEWSYAQVVTIVDPLEKSVKQKDSEITIKTEQLEVSTRTIQDINLTIATTDDNQAVVTNVWDEIIVKNLQTKERITVNEDTEAVWDLTTMIASLWQTQVSSLEKSTPTLAIRYETTQDQVEVLEKVTQESLPLVDSNDLIGVDTDELLDLVEDTVEISSSPQGEIDDKQEPVSVIEQEQNNKWRVLDEKRMQELAVILDQSSLRLLVDNYDSTDSQEEKDAILNSLVATINNALWVFNSRGSTVGSRQNLLSLSNTLLKIFEDEYFIPPTLLNSVRIVLSIQ